MGGVLLRERKNGGSILRGRKIWGEYTLAAEGRGIMSTPPLRVFLAPSLTRISGRIRGLKNLAAPQGFASLRSAFFASLRSAVFALHRLF